MPESPRNKFLTFLSPQANHPVRLRQSVSHAINRLAVVVFLGLLLAVYGIQIRLSQVDVELSQYALLKASADDLLIQSGNLRHLEYTRPNDLTDPKLRQFGFDNQANLFSQLHSRLQLIKRANPSQYAVQAMAELEEILNKLAITPKAGTTQHTSDLIDRWYLQLNGVNNEIRLEHNALLTKAHSLYRLGNRFNLIILLCAIALLTYKIWLHYQDSKAFELKVEALQDEARTDPLTGLPNRRGWEEAVMRIQAQLLKAKRLGKQVHAALAVIDIDHFKQYNDTFGHPHGDQRLRDFAASLSMHFRPIDIVARIGGEEFAVILPHCDIASATKIIERVQAANRELYGEQFIQFSAGVTEILADNSMVHTMALADQALYQAKKQGRDRVVSATARTFQSDSSFLAEKPKPITDNR